MVGRTSASASAMPNLGTRTHYIVHRVLSAAGQKLALTFNGERNTVTVTPLVNATNQAASSLLSFRDDLALMQSSFHSAVIGMGPGIIRVLPPGGYVWTLRNIPSGATIQDGAVTVFWGLSDANVHQEVAFGYEDERGNQSWILIPV